MIVVIVACHGIAIVIVTAFATIAAGVETIY